MPIDREASSFINPLLDKGMFGAEYTTPKKNDAKWWFK